jgi:hypothetical protein
MMMPKLSLSSSDLTLIVPNFDPEHIEKVLKIGPNSLQGYIPSRADRSISEPRG